MPRKTNLSFPLQFLVTTCLGVLSASAVSGQSSVQGIGEMNHRQSASLGDLSAHSAQDGSEPQRMPFHMLPHLLGRGQTHVVVQSLTGRIVPTTSSSIVVGIPVASLSGGEDQGNASTPAEVPAVGEANPTPSTLPSGDYSFRSLANGPAASAPAVAVIRNQPPESKPNAARRSPLLIGLYVSHAILQALDAQSTLRALPSGSVREGNPLLRPFTAQPAALVGFKLGVTAGTIYGIDRLHKSHPRLAIISLAAINGGYVFLVRRNYQSFPAR